MSRGVIVFSGFNQRAVVAFIRTLEKNNIQYSIIANNSNDTIFKTIYRDKVSVTREIASIDKGDILRCVKETLYDKGYDSAMVAPSSEALNRFLIDCRDELVDLNVDLPLVEGDLYSRISDKESFGCLCKDNNIQIPDDYNSPDDLEVPFVAKPREYISPDGNTYSPVLVRTQDEAEDFANLYNKEYFYYQEFIEGDSIYLLYYFYRDGRVAKYSQRNLVQQPEGKSILAAQSSDYHNSPDSTKYEDMFKKVGFFGLVMVEFKVNKSGSYMIEANPRFWGPSQLFVDAGVNLFDDLLVDNGFSVVGEQLESSPKDIKYLWNGGIVESGLENVTYHGITKNDFIDEMDEWLESDVYNRDDTKELYEMEVL